MDYLDPLTLGKYLASLTRLVGARLPRFSAEEAKALKISGIHWFESNQWIPNKRFDPSPGLIEPRIWI